jgi:hypothetical protein
LLGWGLGGSLYYLFSHALYKDLTIFVKNTHRKTWKTLIFNKGTIIFYLIYATAMFNFAFGNLLHPVPEEWIEVTKKNCQGVKGGNNLEIDAELENFVRFNLALTVIGSYLGLIIEQRYMGTRKFKHFYMTTWYVTLSRLILCSAIGFPVLLPMFLMPKYGYHWLPTVVFRTVVPVSMGNCFLFGFSKYIGHRFNLINDSTLDATSSEEDALALAEEINNEIEAEKAKTK